MPEHIQCGVTDMDVELRIVILQSPGDLGNPADRLSWLKAQLLFRGALRGTHKNLRLFKSYCERVVQNDAAK